MAIYLKGKTVVKHIQTMGYQLQLKILNIISPSYILKQLMELSIKMKRRIL